MFCDYHTITQISMSVLKISVTVTPTASTPMEASSASAELAMLEMDLNAMVWIENGMSPNYFHSKHHTELPLT